MASLDAQRAHVLEAVDGLSEEALRRPVLPSGWTCLGLDQHLALDVERFWFRAVVAGEQVQLVQDDAAWRVSQDTAAETILNTYRQEVQLANTVIAGTALNQHPPGGRWRSSRTSRSATCSTPCFTC